MFSPSPGDRRSHAARKKLITPLHDMSMKNQEKHYLSILRNEGRGDLLQIYHKRAFVASRQHNNIRAESFLPQVQCSAKHIVLFYNIFFTINPWHAYCYRYGAERIRQ